MDNPKALFLQAVALFRAGTEHDHEAVALLHRSLFENSYCYSMRPAVAAWLGWAHENGRGVLKDEFTALAWYRRAVGALRYKDSNEEWIKKLEQKLAARNPQPQPTPDELCEWGLGRVIIRWGKEYSYRIKERYAEVTIPEGSCYDMAVVRLWNSLEEREERRKEDNLPALLDETLRRDYPLFELRIERGEGLVFSHRKEGRRYTLIVPRTTRFEERITREVIIRRGLHLMRLAAEEYLPRRLKEISERIGLGYSHCHISSGSQNLGNYYRDGHIDLSYHLMKRTSLQVDAVIVHELCHGVSFDHSAAFYAAVKQYGGSEIAYADQHLYDKHLPKEI